VAALHDVLRMIGQVVAGDGAAWLGSDHRVIGKLSGAVKGYYM